MGENVGEESGGCSVYFGELMAVNLFGGIGRVKGSKSPISCKQIEPQ